jgi:AraC family transcriptional regulator
MPNPTIARRQLTAQPMLFIRREVSRENLPAELGKCLGAVHAHCAQAGLAVAGPPFTRYPHTDSAGIAIEAGIPAAAPAAASGEIEAGFLQAGPAAVALHAGPYDRLGETYAALERWMAENDVRPGGAPWESYLTDPGEHEDPADWRTEVYWPFAE